MESFKNFILKFDNEKIYTQRQMSEALNKQTQAFRFNRVIQRGKDFDVALQIIATVQMEDGTTVIVK